MMPPFTKSMLALHIGYKLTMIATFTAFLAFAGKQLLRSGAHAVMVPALVALIIANTGYLICDIKDARVVQVKPVVLKEDI